MIIVAYIFYFIILYYILKTKNPYSNEEVLNKSKTQYYSLAIVSFISLISFFIFKPEEYFFISILQSIFLFFLWIYVSYFYDNKFVLSIALLFSTIILVSLISPEDALNPLANNKILNFSSILLGFLMIFISYFSIKKNYKKHFHLTYDSFALLLIVFTSILGILLGEENQKNIYLLISILSLFYFLYILYISKSILFGLNVVMIYYFLYISISNLEEIKSKIQSINLPF